MDTLLVLAALSAEEERVLTAIATSSDLKLVACSKVEAAIAWLTAHEPRVLVFKASMPGADRFCHSVRSKTSLATAPLIALTDDASDPAVEKLYALGVDDVLLERFGPGFVTRLRTLPDRMAEPPKRGVAVVAEPDRDRCNVVARVLGNAGYEVKTAVDPISLAYYVQQHKPRLVIASVELGVPRQLVSDARRRGYAAPWIATARRRDFHHHAEGLAGLEKVCVVAATSAPEIILFAANELLRGEEPPARSEERHLYGTSVLFRTPGDELDELGFSYNVSSRGLFVRTLATPEADQVWLELRPPRSRRRVRLEGRVAWRRPYVPTAAPTGPPGFGVELTAGLSGDLPHWVEQATQFASSAQAALLAVSRMHTSRLGDARTSGEYMLLEVPSETKVAIVSAVSDAKSVPPPSPDSVGPRSSSPTIEIAGDPPASWVARVAEDAAIAVSEPVPDLRAEPPPVEFVEPLPPPPRAPQGPGFEADSTAPASMPGTPRRVSQLRSVVGSVGVGLALGTLAAGVYFAWEGPARSRARGVAQEIGPASTSPASPSVERRLVEAPAPLPSSSAPPAESADRVGADAAPPAASAAAVDLTALLWDDGYLEVVSSAAADVYATGFKIGETNQPNKSKCGLRWVRLGKGKPPSWISPGRTVDVKCRAVTRVELAPGPSGPDDE